MNKELFYLNRRNLLKAGGGVLTSLVGCNVIGRFNSKNEFERLKASKTRPIALELGRLPGLVDIFEEGKIDLKDQVHNFGVLLIAFKNLVPEVYSSELQENDIEVTVNGEVTSYEYFFNNKQTKYGERKFPIDATVELFVRKLPNNILEIRPQIFNMTNFDSVWIGIGLSYGLKHGTNALKTSGGLHFPKNMRKPKSNAEFQPGKFSFVPWADWLLATSIYDDMPGVLLTSTSKSASKFINVMPAFIEYETRNVVWLKKQQVLHDRLEKKLESRRWIEMAMSYCRYNLHDPNDVSFYLSLRDLSNMII